MDLDFLTRPFSKTPTILQQHSNPSYHSPLHLLTFSIFTTLPYTKTTTSNTASAADAHPLPKPIADALLQYAGAITNSTNPSRISAVELNSITTILRRCSADCNFLVFGLKHETLLWHALNIAGRTTFVEESAYFVSKLEENHPEIEAYDVQFTTKVCDLHELIDYSRLILSRDYGGDSVQFCRNPDDEECDLAGDGDGDLGLW